MCVCVCVCVCVCINGFPRILQSYTIIQDEEEKKGYKEKIVYNFETINFSMHVY